MQGGRKKELRGKGSCLFEFVHLVAVDWHCRHAALMAISAVGEGCEKEMIPILGDVVNAVLPFCHDQVRWCC